MGICLLPGGDSRERAEQGQMAQRTSSGDPGWREMFSGGAVPIWLRLELRHRSGFVSDRANLHLETGHEAGSSNAGAGGESFREVSGIDFVQRRIVVNIGQVNRRVNDVVERIAVFRERFGRDSPSPAGSRRQSSHAPPVPREFGQLGR